MHVRQPRRSCVVQVRQRQLRQLFRADHPLWIQPPLSLIVEICGCKPDRTLPLFGCPRKRERLEASSVEIRRAIFECRSHVPSPDRMHLGLEHTKREVVASRKDEQPVIRENTPVDPGEEMMFRNRDRDDVSRETGDGAPHLPTRFSMNPPAFSVDFARIVHAFGPDMLLNVLEWCLVFRSIFFAHPGRKIDDPHAAWSSCDVEPVYPWPHYVAIRPAVRVVRVQHRLCVSWKDVERTNLGIAHK